MQRREGLVPICGELRTAPQRVDEIDEVREKPPLRPALLRLNSAASRLWTAKCGIWSTSPDNGDAPLDPYEMDAEPGMTVTLQPISTR